VKGDLIVPGVEYVVSLKPKHVLIPGTNVTYAERLKVFDKLDRRTLPNAALRERRRLGGALLHGLPSRIDRCEGIFKPFFSEAHHKTGTGLIGNRLGTIMTVVAKEPTAVTVEADFEAQQRGMTHPVGDCFDPSISQEVKEDPDEYDRRRFDPARRLRAVVHPQAIRYLYDDGLLDRLDAERRERVRRAAAKQEQRSRAFHERYADKIVERFVNKTLTDANRPDDDEWEALA
jgi:hypothetical protein